MNITQFKYPFLVSILLLLINSSSSGQTASSANTLGGTGITSIQSTTASGYKLSIGGATKIFGEGTRGTLGSPTLLIHQIPGSVTDGGNYGIYTSEDGHFQIYDVLASGSPVRFNIAPSTGNIGIGISTPGQKLDVDGNIKFSGALMPNNAAGTSGQVLTSAGTGAPPTWTTPSISGYLPLAGGGLTGNLGILYPAGSPPAPLTIGTAGTIRMYNSVNNNYSMISNPGSGGNSDLAFTSGGGEAIRILGSMNVGIGTTSPVEKLDVGGNVKFSGALMPNNAAGTSGQVLTSAGTGAPPTWTTLGGGSGTVTSVGMTVPTGFNVSPSSITSSGTFAVTTSLSSGIVKVSSGAFTSGAVNIASAEVSGTLPIANGGTGAVTAGAALNNLLPSQSGNANKFLQTDGTNTSWVTPSGGGSSNWTLTGNDIYNNNSGNTGVGTSAPEQKLDINGMAQLKRSADATAGATLKNSNILQLQSAYWNGSSSANSNWQIQSVQGVPGVASGSNLVISNDGVTRFSMNYDGLNFYNRFGTEFMNYNTQADRIYTLSSLWSNGVYNSGPVRTTTVGGLTWSASQILFDNYIRSITYVATGDAGSDNTAHHFSVNSAMTGTNSLLASWDNAGSTLVAITKEGKLKIGSTPSLTDKLDVYGNISIMGTNPATDGKFLIGTTAGAATGHRLAVNGSALFTKAVVKLTTSWPDYVFAPSYKLLPLNELETYLVKNQHLPGLPAAAEVEKNGIDLGDNQTILLKKVEELTLYVIDLNKKMEVLNKENEQLKKKVNSNNQ